MNVYRWVQLAVTVSIGLSGSLTISQGPQRSSDDELRAARILRVALRNRSHGNDVMANKYFRKIVNELGETSAAGQARTALGLKRESAAAPTTPSENANPGATPDQTTDSEGFRNWTAEGQTQRLKYIALLGGTVIFEKPEGERILIELKKLSEQDQEYLRNQRR